MNFYDRQAVEYERAHAEYVDRLEVLKKEGIIMPTRAELDARVVELEAAAYGALSFIVGSQCRRRSEISYLLR